MIQEWWGLVPHIIDVCDRFAAEGFVALAPDLYRGETTTEPDEAGKLMMAMNIEQAAKDMAGAVDEVGLLAGGDRVGVTGFCMGGGLALVLATQRPDKVKAVRALVRDHPVARRCSRTGRGSTLRSSGTSPRTTGSSPRRPSPTWRTRSSRSARTPS